MARGDLTVFNELVISLGEKKINLETDDIRVMLITNAGGAPDQDEAAPAYSTYSANEVAEAVGGYTATGVLLSGPELVRSVAVATFDDDDSDIALTQNGAGFDDAYYAIIYSDTATGKEAICFIDLLGPLSQIAGPININFNASGILTITRT